MEKSKAIIELRNSKIKIKWNNFFVDSDSRDLEFDASFEIQPRDFLEYAKQDLKQGNDRGKINAISNIKKAIEYIGNTADNKITILTTYTALLKIDKIKEMKKCF